MMHTGSALKLSGLILLISLVIVTAVYQSRESANLMYLFGLYLLTGIFGAFFFFKVVLPVLGDSITTAMMESGEEPEEPPMVRIRELIAAGEFESAAEELVHVAAANPGDPVPWLERMALLDGKLADSDGAVQTLEVGLKSFEWETEDAANFLFRIVEIREKQGKKEEVIAVLDRIIERFPATRFSANANHKKRELQGDIVEGKAAGGNSAGQKAPPPPGSGGGTKRVTPPPPSAS